MRITNKIMQRNNLSNINTNKIYQDKLSTQMSTQKKINRPSDDPVIAIRALRLRSNVTEITQYYSKNIPDAESWLDVTEKALDNLSQVMKKMIEQCTKGSTGSLKTEVRKIILEQMQALGDEVYATGDADYAGRYVFTGYRTDTSLSFGKEHNQKYTLTEQLDISAIDSVTKVDTGKLLEVNSANYMTTNVTENDISSVETHRIRLAYNDCLADGAPSIQFQRRKSDDPTNPDYNVYETVTWDTLNTDAAGNPKTPEIKIMHSYETNPKNPYAMAADDPNAVIFVPETGELLLGSKRFEELMAVKDNEATKANEGEIRVTYQKEHWESTDLRPEHYFYCESDPDDPEKKLTYNESYLTGEARHQEIEYDVGFNQKIKVNSTADECFQHGIGREVDDLVSAMQSVLDLEDLENSLKGLLKDAAGDEAATAQLEKQLAAVGKALTYAKDKEQKMFESAITQFQGYRDDAGLSITNCGNMSSKLDLIKNRTQGQKTTFETLKSENEDVDITEVAIYLQSAEMTYEAALLAAGKVMQATLLNFI